MALTLRLPLPVHLPASDLIASACFAVRILSPGLKLMGLMVVIQGAVWGLLNAYSAEQGHFFHRYRRSELLQRSITSIYR